MRVFSFENQIRVCSVVLAWSNRLEYVLFVKLVSLFFCLHDAIFHDLNLHIVKEKQPNNNKKMCMCFGLKIARPSSDWRAPPKSLKS